MTYNQYLMCFVFSCRLQLGEHCSELKDIHLGQCYSVTDEGMVALAKGCRKLQRLYLQENKLVSVTRLVSYMCFSSPLVLVLQSVATIKIQQ